MVGTAEDIFYVLNNCDMYKKGNAFKMIFAEFNYGQPMDEVREYTFSLAVAPKLTFVCKKYVSNQHISFSFGALSDVGMFVHISEKDIDAMFDCLNSSLDIIKDEAKMEEEKTKYLLKDFIASLKHEA
jgi:hypothetical protein